MLCKYSKIIIKAMVSALVIDDMHKVYVYFFV